MADAAETLAIRLLSALRCAQAYGPARAVTDQRLMVLMQLRHPRPIVEAAAELLDCGILCCATCGPTPGRYLLRPGDDLEPARAYLRSLTRRAKAIFGRVRRTRRALHKVLADYEAARGRGQLELPFPRSVDPAIPRTLCGAP